MYNLTRQFAQLRIPVHAQVLGSGAARTILEVAKRDGVDLIILASHGSGGIDRKDYVKLGSCVDRVISEAPCPVFFVSSTPPENF